MEASSLDLWEGVRPKTLQLRRSTEVGVVQSFVYAQVLMDRVCPRDFTLLSSHEWGAATYQHCPTCDGVLLERSEVEKLVQSGAHPPTRRPEKGLSFEDGTALCSCSDATMQTVSREGVAVDVCPACGAVWFDAGELQRVVAEKRRKFASLPSPGRRGVEIRAVDLWDLFDGVLWILSMLGR